MAFLSKIPVLCSLCLQGLMPSQQCTDSKVVPLHQQEEFVENLKLRMQSTNTHSKKELSSYKTKPLKILTFNAGLLHFQLAKVPYYKERSESFEKNFVGWVKENDPDIIMLQEIWYEKDKETLIENAYLADHYNFYYPSGTSYGLMTLVKKSTMNSTNEITRNTISFTSQTPKEKFVDITRGYTIVEFELSQEYGSKQILLINTHLPFSSNSNEVRINAINELIEVIQYSQALTDIVILGGDFNASPTFKNAKPKENALWQGNTQVYLTLLNKLAENNIHLLDTYWAVNADDGFTQDRVNNPLTAISSTTKNEPEQRLDFIFVTDRKGSLPIYTESSELVFKDPIKLTNEGTLTHKGQELPLSDHFGVYSILRIKK